MSWTRRRFIQAGATLGLTPRLLALADAGQPRKPNVVFILTDQQHRLSMSCAGNPVVTTPNLDRLASEGMRFTRAYCQTPQCVPSRMSMNTAKYTAAHKTMWNRDPVRHDQLTVAQKFRQAGYVTGTFGKMHVPPAWVRSHGWDESILAGEYQQSLAKQGLENYMALTGKGPCGPKTNWWTGTAKVPKEHFFATWTTNNGIDFINRHKGQPFYLTISYYGPHAPWTPPKPYDTLYSPDLVRLPNNRPDDQADKPDLLAQQIRRGKQTPDAATRNMIVKYYGLVKIIDDQIGRVLRTLDQLGLTDNTIVLFTSDHGEMLGEHHMIGKGFYMYDANVRVALLARYPGVIPAGRESDALVETMDVPQTLLDLAGAELLDNVQGRSFKRVLTGKDNEHRKYVHSAMRHPSDKRGYLGMVASRDHKLVWYHAEGPDAKILFDLKRDPAEFKNVINAPAYAQARSELTREMQRWHRSMSFNPDTYRPPPAKPRAKRTLPPRRPSGQPPKVRPAVGQ